MNIKNTLSDIEVSKAGNLVQQDLDAATDALQAVVMAQKAQIDALLAGLEGLLVALNSPATPLEQGWAQPLMVQAMQKSLQGKPELVGPALVYERPKAACVDSTLLGNSMDPQFVQLHQLMRRLKLG